MASSAFIQFAPINSLTDMLSSSMILSKVLSRCLHCFNFDGVATSSVPNGKYFLVYISGSSNQSSKLFLLFATFSPLITDDLLVTSPLSVFTVIDVLLPFMPNHFSNLSKLKVPWIQLSKVHTYHLHTSVQWCTCCYFTICSLLTFFTVTLVLSIVNFLSDIAMECNWMFPIAHLTKSFPATILCIVVLFDFLKVTIT